MYKRCSGLRANRRVHVNRGSRRSVTEVRNCLRGESASRPRRKTRTAGKRNRFRNSSCRRQSQCVVRRNPRGDSRSQRIGGNREVIYRDTGALRDCKRRTWNRDGGAIADRSRSCRRCKDHGHRCGCACVHRTQVANHGYRSARRSPATPRRGRGRHKRCIGRRKRIRKGHARCQVAHIRDRKCESDLVPDPYRRRRRGRHRHSEVCCRSNLAYESITPAAQRTLESSLERKIYRSRFACDITISQAIHGDARAAIIAPASVIADKVPAGSWNRSWSYRYAPQTRRNHPRSPPEMHFASAGPQEPYLRNWCIP